MRRWLPELACLPACLALEPWRLLARAEGVAAGPDGTPLLPPAPAWACGACTMLNGPDDEVCAACEGARPLGWGDFLIWPTLALNCPNTPGFLLWCTFRSNNGTCHQTCMLDHPQEQSSSLLELRFLRKLVPLMVLLVI